MPLKILSTIICILLVHLGFSQIKNTSRLDSLFLTLSQNDQFMGSVAMAENGRQIYQNTIGFSDVNTGHKSDQATRYRIGSISKIFTATLIFKAIEEKRISLDQSLNHYFPQIKNAGQITIRHLLMHRSGIHNFTDDSLYMTYYTSPKTEKELTDIIIAGGSKFTPGSKAEYSNSNYVLLTLILEKIYKVKFSTLLDQKILTPLQLRNTRSGGKINVSQNEAYSYSYKDGWQKSAETDMSIPLGAGNMVSNTSDLLTFIEALFSGKVISSSSLDSMKSTQNNIGKGLFSIPFNEKKGFGHNGGIDGFQSMLYYFPDEKVSLCILSNGTRYPLNNIAIATLSWTFDVPFSLPAFKKINLNSADLDAYTGVYSSKEIPLKITISKENTTLIAQATGQNPISLEATDIHIFEFRPAGLVLEFDPSVKKMLLLQGGGRFSFSKE